MRASEKTVRRGLWDRRIRGRAALAIGLAHFAFPNLFDPINRLGFPGHARTFTYINGGIESAMGVLMASRRAQRQANILAVCYVVYLTGNFICARATRRAATVVQVDGTA